MLKSFDQAAVFKSSYARILLLGASKVGKSTACITTAPDPYVINCDPVDALHYPSTLGVKFKGAHAHSSTEWQAACEEAVQLAEEGPIRTILVDTLTLLSDSILEENKVRGLRGFDIWTVRDDVIMKGMRTVLDAKAHVICVSHLNPRSEGPAGILPAVGGKALAEHLPNFLSDWILFDIEPGRQNPAERCFVLGAQKNWTHSGRNLKGSKLIPADVGLLLEEMGFEK